jgi:ribose transport system substrate-binding protein
MGGIKKMKRIIVFCLAVVVALAICACTATAPEVTNTSSAKDTGTEVTDTQAVESAQSAAVDEAKTSGFTYGVSLQTLNGAFHLAELSGIEKAVKEIDPTGEIVALGADKQPDLQVEQFEDLISKGVDIILVDPVDSGSIKTALLSAQAAGIPVVNIDSPVNDLDLVISVNQSDNYMAGQIAGQAILDKMGDEGKIAILNHPSVQACADRARAMYDLLADYPNIKVVADLNFIGATNRAQEMIETILIAHPDLDAVFCIADCGSYGAVAAAKANGYKPGDILITGVDGEQAAADLIKEGWMLGTSAQFADQLGYLGIEVAFKYLTGKAIEESILVDVQFVDSSNVDSYVGF